MLFLPVFLICIILAIPLGLEYMCSIDYGHGKHNLKNLDVSLEFSCAHVQSHRAASVVVDSYCL